MEIGEAPSNEIEALGLKIEPVKIKDVMADGPASKAVLK
jgi:hypothetical protein